MSLASIESSIGAAVLVAVMLLIRWLGDRFAEKRADSKVAAHRLKKSAAALGARGDSEEERVRRFLEALGIPADSEEAKRATTPPPIRRQQRREPPARPEQPKPKSTTSGFPRRQAPPPPPIPTRAEEPPPLVQTTTEIVPAVHVRTLEVKKADLPETFQTITSAVTIVPVEAAAVPTGGGTRPEGELWREALRSPQALRSAIILQEILGPPRSLQTDKIPHSFPSL